MSACRALRFSRHPTHSIKKLQWVSALISSAMSSSTGAAPRACASLIFSSLIQFGYEIDDIHRRGSAGKSGTSGDWGADFGRRRKNSERTFGVYRRDDQQSGGVHRGGARFGRM